MERGITSKEKTDVELDKTQQCARAAHIYIAKHQLTSSCIDTLKPSMRRVLLPSCHHQVKLRNKAWQNYIDARPSQSVDWLVLGTDFEWLGLIASFSMMIASPLW